MARVQQLLRAVPEPARLTLRDRAYYHWLQGLVLANEGRREAAKAELLTAVQGQLRTDNDRSVVHCQLAELALQAKELATAQAHLDRARALAHRPAVDEIIQQLQEQLQQAA